MTYHFPRPVSELVREALMEHPAPVQLKAYAMAETLSITSRTMDLRLRAEGTTWSRLKDNVLSQIHDACHENMTELELCRRLGFQSITAFRVASRRWADPF